jgi:NitT/TauT family transport system ATP-binding protein
MNAKTFRVSGLSFSYGKEPVLDRLEFQLTEGEFVAIVGASGCGKSTILQILAGDLTPGAGAVLRPKRFRRVHQQDGLLPWLSVEENIRLGLRGASPDCEADFGPLVKTLGIGDHLQHFPRELSGGLRQRVELARALVGRPEALLLDEPFSSLDYLTRLETREYLAQVLKQRPITVVMVTHDIPEALYFADRILLLAGRPAAIKRIIMNPARDVSLAESIWKELR